MDLKSHRHQSENGSQTTHNILVIFSASSSIFVWLILVTHAHIEYPQQGTLSTAWSSPGHVLACKASARPTRSLLIWGWVQREFGPVPNYVWVVTVWHSSTKFKMNGSWIIVGWFGSGQFGTPIPSMIIFICSPSNPFSLVLYTSPESLSSY